jgi:ankyrin repeat protein
VLSAKGKDNMRKVLETLQPTLHETYDNIMRRIEKQAGGTAETAKKTLTWVYHARRPLEMDELREALAFEIGDRDRKENGNSATAIIDCCLSFVTYEKSTGIVRFLHPSVPRWLKSQNEKLLPEWSLAMTCLNYLNFDVFEEPCPDLESLKNRAQQYMFGRYAAAYWAIHAGNDGTQTVAVKDAILKTFRSAGKRDSMEQLNMIFVSLRLFRLRKKTFGKSLFHVLVDRRSTPVCKSLLSDLLSNTNDMCIPFPSELIERLQTLGGQATINSRDNNGRTVLQHFALSGDLEVVKQLHQKGADIHVTDKRGQTALHEAAKSGNLDVVKWLYEKGADIHVTDKRGQTALHDAAKSGNLDVVKWLDEKGADIHVIDTDGQTALHYAAEYGQLDVVQWLCENGADINAADNKGMTPSLWAAKKGNSAVVEWLREEGANFNAADTHGVTVSDYLKQAERIRLTVHRSLMELK